MQVGDEQHRVVKQFTKLEIHSLFFIAAALLVGFGLDLADQPFYEECKGWMLAGLGVAFLYVTVPPIIRCGRAGIKSVWSVIRAAVILLAVTLLVFYTSYYWIVAALPGDAPPPSDKVLNFPPILAALWAAGIGWYVHYQASAKNHRTTNSFNLLMQTRTSKEFLERGALVALTYPHGCEVPACEASLFHQAALKNLIAREQQEIAEQGKASDDVLESLRKARGADALKYLLNYYEFMAVGIQAKDLEEELLYETIGVNVTSVFDRAKEFVSYCRKADGGNQPLAFETLEALAARWRKRLADEIHAKPK